VVSSVHAFAKSSIGGWFLGFLIVMVVGAVFLLVLRLPELRAHNEMESMVSREAGFLFNNLLLLGACFAVLWGTIFPIVSEAVQGVKITVGAPFFNKINVPLGMALLLLTGIGPVLAWRKTSGASLRRNFAIPALVGITCGAAGAVLAPNVHPYAIISFALCGFVTATIVAEFWRGTRARQRNTGEVLPVALWRLTLKNKRRYGGYIIHFGIVVLFVGLTGKAFTQEGQFEIGVGETVQIGKFELLLDKITEAENANYASGRLWLTVFKNGQQVAVLAPERRFYKTSQQPTTEVSVRSTVTEDLYTVFAAMTQDGQKAVLQVWVNPLVNFVWGGGFLVCVGTIIAMLPDRAMRRRLERMVAESGSSAAGEEAGARA
jgi:cytochrome c-type biogenesis protein CcmF